MLANIEVKAVEPFAADEDVRARAAVDAVVSGLAEDYVGAAGASERTGNGLLKFSWIWEIGSAGRKPITRADT